MVHPDHPNKLCVAHAAGRTLGRCRELTVTGHQYGGRLSAQPQATSGLTVVLRRRPAAKPISQTSSFLQKTIRSTTFIISPHNPVRSQNCTIETKVCDRIREPERKRAKALCKGSINGEPIELLEGP